MAELKIEGTECYYHLPEGPTMTVTLKRLAETSPNSSIRVRVSIPLDEAMTFSMITDAALAEARRLQLIQ